MGGTVSSIGILTICLYDLEPNLIILYKYCLRERRELRTFSDKTINYNFDCIRFEESIPIITRNIKRAFPLEFFSIKTTESKIITKVDSENDLGVTVDKSLKFTEHIDNKIMITRQ